MELRFLSDIVIILGLSVLIILIFQKMKLPAILGFLITGIVVGPHGLNLITSVHEVELLAETGIILLLFVIGIEFSFKNLFSIKRTVLIGGVIQVCGTIGLVTLLSLLFGLSVQSAVFMGFLLSLSSTAIVLKMLQERGELNSPHGRISLAILIFQDIIVVLMILLTPILAGQFENTGMTLLLLLAKVTGIIIAIILLARYLIPVLFRVVIKTKSRELFIITIIGLCFATAWLTSFAGLSLALGAFFAGLIISDSDYSHQATANIIPFREIFISFFFVSVGMLLDFSFFIENILFIHLAALVVICIKILVVGFSVFLLGYQTRTIILTSLAIFQVGEFAFLLSASGMEYNLLSREIYQYFLVISIISMGATPFIINFSPAIADFILRIPLPRPVRTRLKILTTKKTEISNEEKYILHDHLVIIGFGINGENVAKAARSAQIPYIIVELDPNVIQKAKEKNEPVIFGDATNEAILKHVHVQKARIVVVAISAHDATRQIVRTIRTFTETAYIIVRTRYVKEMEEIIKLGADEVIPEEFETSIEIFTRVLKKYLVPNDEIQGFVNEIRSHNYEMFRSIPPGKNGLRLPDIHIPDMEIATLPVQQGQNKIIGKTIYESGIRTNYNVTVLAIKRNEQYITEIKPDEVIKQDDILYVFGRPDDIININKFLKLS